MVNTIAFLRGVKRNYWRVRSMLSHIRHECVHHAQLSCWQIRGQLSSMRELVYVIVTCQSCDTPTRHKPPADDFACPACGLKVNVLYRKDSLVLLDYGIEVIISQ